MMRDRTVVSFKRSFLWMLMTQVIIVFYMFYVVPPGKDVLFLYHLRWLFDGECSLPDSPHYILPILALLIIVIFLGNYSFHLWLLGMPVLYIALFIQFFIISPGPIRENAFGIVTFNGFAGMDSLTATMPFWCIFFFLWELLFCVIAKWWRRKRDSKDREME